MGEEKEKEKEREKIDEVNGFWGEGFTDRTLVHIDDIIGENVIIQGYDRREGTFGEYFSVYIDNNRVVNTGSILIMSKIQSREDLLPAEGRFVRRSLPGGKRMYDIVAPDRTWRGE